MIKSSILTTLVTEKNEGRVVDWNIESGLSDVKGEHDLSVYSVGEKGIFWVSSGLVSKSLYF